MKRLIRGFIRGFLCAPFLFIIFAFVQFVRATLTVSLTVGLGKIITEVSGSIDSGGTVKSVLHPLILFGVGSLALWVFVELQWRLSDDVLPVTTRVRSEKRILVSCSAISLRRFDNSEFCDSFERYKKGVQHLPDLTRKSIVLTVQIYQLILCCVSLWTISWMFVILLVAFSFLSYLQLRKNIDVYDEVRTSEAPLNRKTDYIEQLFIGQQSRETRIYGIADYLLTKWSQIKEQRLNISLQAERVIQHQNFFPELLKNGIAPLCNLLFACFLAYKGQITVGGLYLVWTLSTEGIMSALTVGDNIINLFTIAKEADDVFLFEKENLPRNMVNPIVTEPILSEPILQLEHVSFSYNGRKKTVDDVSFTLRTGEVLALVGENGSGKSTLMKLITGFYTPDSGSVRLYGQEVSLSGPDYVRRYVGGAFQDFVQFPFTVRENIGFGNLKNIYSDEKICCAVSMAGGEKFWEKLQPLDDFLGRTLDENGKELSGGEWQKLAVARAFLSDRDCMIFDEPTSGLDAMVESTVYENLIRACKNKALILVSHRLGFSKYADKILVMDKGKIVECGSYESLMQKKGKYYRLFTAQRDAILFS